MSAENSWMPLRETITHGPEKSNFREEDVSGPTIHPDDGPGVSNTVLLTPNEDLEDAIGRAPTVAAGVSSVASTVGVPSSEDLTQAGEPLGAAGGCVPSMSVAEGVPAGNFGLLQVPSSSLEAWDKDASVDTALLGTQGEGRYAEGGSRRSKGVSPSSFCGDDVVWCPLSGETSPGTNGLAPTSLVNNEAGHTATHRAPACAEPPRTGEEEEPVDTPGDTAREMSWEHGNAGSINGEVKPTRSKRQPPVGMGNKSGEESSKAVPTKTSKPKGASQNTKFREAGGHAVADDDIARCEAVADAFYKNPEDMDAFIEDILLMPQSQVYELTVRLGEGYRDWKEKTLCSQFVKENPGSLWGSKFREILIHKRDPVTMVISCYSLATCIAMGGSTFKLGGKDFQVPKYSQYANNYHVTFHKVNNPSVARAIVKQLALLTKGVIAAFNPTADQNVASPHLRVIFKTSSPPVALVPKEGPPLREITVVDPAGQPVALVFQHKIAVLNKHVPPSVKARQRKPTGPGGSSRDSTTNTTTGTPRTSTGKTTATTRGPTPLSPTPEVEHADTRSHAGSDMSIEHGRGEAPTVEDEDMGDAAVSPSVVLNTHPSEENAMEVVETPHQTQPATAPDVEEQYSSSPLEFQLVTGDRFNPAPKRPLSPLSPQVTTSNRYAVLQEDDLDLSLEGFALPRIVVEDPEFPRTTTLAKKSRPNKSKHAHFERAAKLIREKDVESNILACTRLLNDEPQVVAHSMYPAEAEFGLLKALASTRTIHRLMASRTTNGDSGDYTTYLPFYAKGCQDPQELVRELVGDPAEYTVRLALGTVDLFLSNRAPDLYNNLEALDHFCGQRATRWETGDVLTDLSILKVARTLYPTLKSMNLPSFIGDALEFLVETVIDHSTNLDTLCDEATHSIQATAWEDLDDLQVSA